MAKQPDIKRLIELHKLTLAFQAIERYVVYIGNDNERSENDVEHSYSLAMAAWFLAQYFPKLDTNSVIRLALVHDIVEVHAGDTSVFAEESQLASKKAREAAALGRLEQEWPDFPELTKTIQTYEERASEEAKFVYALDKIMPLILNYIFEGYGWRKHKITLEQLHSLKKDKVAASEPINEYYQQLYALLQQHADYFHHNN